MGKGRVVVLVVVFPFGGGGGRAAYSCLAPAAAPSGRFRMRLDSLRGRLWRHPGPQFMTVGLFAFAQQPLYAPPPPVQSCLLCVCVFFSSGCFTSTNLA